MLMSTLEELSISALARGPAQGVEYDKCWITWEEMRRVADRVNALIDASGADPHGPVVLIPRNRPSALAALLGMITRGRHIRMVHVYQSPVGLVRDIGRLRPVAVVGAAEDVSSTEVRSTLQAGGIAGIALTEMDAAAVPGCERSTAAFDPPPPAPQIDLLTSGTTGPPKQFALGYEMIAKQLVGVNVMNTADITEPAKLSPWFLYYPLGNFSGLYAILPPVLQGIRCVLVERFTLAAWHDYILRYRPYWTGLPTAGLQMILEADIPAADLASVRCVLSGAAPLDPTVQRLFEERYGKPVLLTYGATELGGPVSMMTLELYQQWGKKKLGSVGRPYAGAQFRIVDPDTGAVLRSGTEGLLEVISPRMGPDWIRTSDIALLDEDGFLFHRGRADGAIVRGGFKLLPDVIERALGLHEAVSAAGVTGIPDKRLGQVPAVAIQLKPGVPRPAIADLERHLRDQVEATHIPVTWRFVETLPYNPMMKLDRVALRRLFESAG